MTVVHLVRHGLVHNPTRVIYGHMAGFHLSELGVQMAKVAADSIADRDVIRVFASPLDRAIETAEQFSSHWGVSIRTDPRLVEPWSYFEGKRFAVGDGALRRPMSWWLLRNPFRPSWGEPYQDVVARMRAALFDVRDEVRGHEAVCVSHQLPIEVLRRSICKRRLWHDPRKRMVSLASITSFVFDGDDVVDVRYAEPAIDLVPVKLRTRVKKR